METIGFNKHVYLETSAVNFLSDNYFPQDGNAIRAYYSDRGSRFYVSPVTIWEILLTSHDGRREILIQFLQNIGYHKLLNSPAEFAINYIKAGCPKFEENYESHSLQPLAKFWQDVAENPAMTLKFDKDQLQNTARMTREGFEYAAQWTENVGITGLIIDPATQQKLGLDELLKQIKSLNYLDLSYHKRRQFKLSIMLMLIVLCYSPGIPDPSVEKFWSDKHVGSTGDKLVYLLTYHESLVYRGPFAVMSTMALQQLGKDGKMTRGIYWDILHSIYLLYTDMFLTRDNHFTTLRDKQDNTVYKRITFLPETGSLFNTEDIDFV